MSIFFVRHAEAGNRNFWSKGDLERPLTQRGRQQAERLVNYFASSKLRAVCSSPATRCRQTVEPLATAHALEVDVRSALYEGAADKALWEMISRYANEVDDVVFCSHGDIIPRVIYRLMDNGVAMPATLAFAKASVWELKTANGLICEATYTPQPLATAITH